MKITLASDLHLEFCQAPTLTAQADVLILAGDICVADHLNRSKDSPYYKIAETYRTFFADCKAKYEHVLYVAGNHEHYHGKFFDTYSILKRELGKYATVLNNETVEINGVKFIGSTMWSDANKQNPITENHLQNYMNDYRVITTYHAGVYRKLRVEDTIREHLKAVEFIDRETSNHDQCIVITHHGPTHLSIGDRFKNDYHGNGGYVSDLFDFIHDRPQIKLFCHGHVHHTTTYHVNQTTIACNPGGYPGENTDFNRSLVFEI